MFDSSMITEIAAAFWESVYMTLISTGIAYAVGLPLGLVLVATDKDGIKPMPLLNQILGIIINIMRSIPFLLLAVAISPFTELIVGTTIGPKATIVALIVAAIPFVARMVESSLKEVDKGVVEAAQSMGASPFEIMTKVLLVEAKPSLLTGSIIAMTTILGYSAAAGFMAGGGLGTIAINYGYYRFEPVIMWIMVLLLVIIVQILQEIGLQISKRADKRL